MTRLEADDSSNLDLPFVSQTGKWNIRKAKGLEKAQEWDPNHLPYQSRSIWG